MEVKNLLKKVLPSSLYAEIRWYVKHYPPPPESVKRRMFRRYARQYDLSTFVETGTFHGDTLWALKDDFNTLFSIELSPTLYQKARERFKNFDNVHPYQGDSSKVLPTILLKLETPALFYLDAHGCGLDSAKGEINTPILQELQLILSQPYINVICIDDARLFQGWHLTGAWAYPTLQEVKDFVSSMDSKRHVTVRNDVIIVT